MPFSQSARLGPRCLTLLILWGLLAGCQSLPLGFGPHFVYEPLPLEGEPLTGEIEVLDERPAWQKTYWQGAESPRDFEQAITVIPLEKFRPDPGNDASQTLGDRLKLDEAGRSANLQHLSAALATELERAPFQSRRSVLHLKSFLVVVNKSDVYRDLWEKSAEARREALAKWRRGSIIRTSVGLSTGYTPGLRSDGFGGGVMLGAPSEIPTLPGEAPLARTWGAVTGPPPELGDFGPDVTCVIEAELELHLDRDEPRVLALSALTRSLPLEPPHCLTDVAVPATARQAFLLLVANAREQFVTLDPENAPAESESP